jgi:hypothetical protein
VNGQRQNPGERAKADGDEQQREHDLVDGATGVHQPAHGLHDPLRAHIGGAQNRNRYAENYGQRHKRHGWICAFPALAREGVLDILASDYVPANLRLGAFLARRVDGYGLPAALRTVTLHPARAGVYRGGRRVI